MELKVNSRENIYFGLRIVFSMITLGYLVSLVSGLFQTLSQAGAPTLATLGIVFVYAFLIIFYIFIIKIFMVGHLKGNGVQVTGKQFPEVYSMIQEIAKNYGIKEAPPVFLLQSGGVLNAFATRFAGKNYIALYSEVFNLLYSDPQALKFVLAHEMAHVQRGHMQKRFWTILSEWVPFLGVAYSRACEYTCDNFGASCAPEGSRKALVMLAAGVSLYSRVDQEEYLASAERNNSASVKLAGLLFSHPHLPKRLKNLAG